jgi:hypothetical protein
MAAPDADSRSAVAPAVSFRAAAAFRGVRGGLAEFRGCVPRAVDRSPAVFVAAAGAYSCGVVFSRDFSGGTASA